MARLMESYGKNYVAVLQDGKERKPVCSMWDPIVAPSFDEEGKKRYLDWLSMEYGGDIEIFNKAYGTAKAGFLEIRKRRLLVCVPLSGLRFFFGGRCKK